jgi:hypothetical protein
MAAQLPKNHETLYFDTLNRKDKAETLQAFIYASYYASKDAKDVSEIKDLTIKKLEYAYALYRGRVGSYGQIGDEKEKKQFLSQYTIGLEMCIWKNEKLELTKKAIEVAENKRTIREYFDVILLNYVQPVNEVMVHLLYHLLTYMDIKKQKNITKDEMKDIYAKVGNSSINSQNESAFWEHINSAYNFLISSNYFIGDEGKKVLTWNYIDSIKTVMNRCDVQFVEKGYEKAKEELADEQKYILYLQNDHGIYNDIISDEETDLCILSDSREKGGVNRIYYGIPGCGKSFKISAMLGYKEGFYEEASKLGIKAKVPEENIFRTTFYLDYANSDFVGQLMPKTEGDKVFYKPVFGPFTKALQRTFETDEMIYLVIEEINRGNAAAIFGDIFQLLDRYKEDNGGHKKGDSMYPITNDFIEDYLGIEKGQVIIPSNLTILATMNTSDQNVFPLDTAFKRRWDRERVVPNWQDKKIQDFVGMYVPYTNIKWAQFAEKVNKALSEESKDGMILEDKQLGPFYVGKDVLTENPEDKDETKLYRFVNNVVDYLYNDVTKFEHSILFESFKGYDDLYDQIFSEEKKSVARGATLGLKILKATKQQEEVEYPISIEEDMDNEEQN